MAIDMAGIAPWEWEVRAGGDRAAGDAPPPWAWDMRAHALQWMPELMLLWALEPSPHTTYEDFHRRVHPDDVAAIECAWQAAIGDGRAFELEFRLVLPTGDVRWIYSKGGAVRDEAGRPVRMVGNNIDITERKRADEALREADRHKSDFLAMLAHELRNPLAPVRTAAEVLRRFHADAGTPQLQAVDAIRRQVEQMTRLIDDLLDVSRIAQGKIALRRATIDVTPVIDADGRGLPLVVRRRRPGPQRGRAGGSAPGRCRSHARGPGDRQPAEQRRQVHAGGWTRAAGRRQPPG